MQRVLSLMMAACVALTLSLDVHAKRMGSGQSLGSAPSHQVREASPQHAPAAAPLGRPQQQPAASGASRWLGPLAGLAAGGLLAALFMGDGFEGIQFMDILLFGLIAFLLYYFLVMRKRAQAQATPAMAGHAPSAAASPLAQRVAFEGLGSSAQASPTQNAPAWFNEQNFLAAAREHYLDLQRHWNVNDMQSIAEFVTPQMFGLLKQERERLGSAHQTTQIENLQIQLDGVDDLADKTVATLTFSGLSKESMFDKGEFFSESWRMERLQGADQPWLLAGIRQNG